MADPDILKVGTGANPRFYVYATIRMWEKYMPIMSSTDFGTWAVQNEDGMPAGPGPWAYDTLMWAPEVHKFGNQYVAFYSASVAGSSPTGDPIDGVKCIGRGVSANPGGPFTPSANPFLCDHAAGGVIDASVYVDANQTPWLQWKTDGNNQYYCGCTSRIWSRQLNATGSGFAPGSGAVALLDDGGDYTIENPDMFRTPEGLWLFYSAGRFDGNNYRTGVASCAGPIGPCTKINDGLLTNGNGLNGPGGASLEKDVLGRPWMAYHSGPMQPSDQRRLQMERVRFTSGGPYIDYGANHVGNPGGVLDTGEAVPGGMKVGGWAIDPSTANPDIVEFYANTQSGGTVFKGSVLANVDRSDLATFGVGTAHGFTSTISLLPGVKTVCAYGLNLHEGNDRAFLGCKTVTVLAGDPIGSFDQGVGGPGKITASGWAIDPDVTSAASVHIYVDDVYKGSFPASVGRTDVGTAYPGYGPNHGWSATVTGLYGGTHKVCAFAINQGAGSQNTQIGCKYVVSPGGKPIGVVDQSSGASTLAVSGWAIDPDTPNAVTIRTIVDGQVTQQVVANGSRPDVGAAYPGYGNNHGWSVVVTGLDPGMPHDVCIEAVNVGTGTGNLTLVCYGFQQFP